MSSLPRDRIQLLAIFLISVVLLAYQVILTRLFSVVFFYHFAFAGISLAMLGLTIGAVRVFVDPVRYAPDRLAFNWGHSALGFALSSVAAGVLFLYLPRLLYLSLSLSQAAVEKAALISMMMFAVPFTFGGLCVALMLTQSPVRIGALYAADLIGAALGCIAITAILFWLDPITVLFVIGGSAALAAALMAPKSLLPRAQVITAVLLAAAVVQGAAYRTDLPHLGLVWSKGLWTAPSLFERWNAISLIRVSARDDIPFGWGFVREPRQRIEQRRLDIDHSAETTVTRFDGDLAPLAYLHDDVINIGYRIRPVERAAVIGLGGGRDVLSALSFHVGHVTGIELNPTIFEILTNRFVDFTGHLDRRADVSLVRAEARSWLTASSDQFDLIELSLIDTWAVTAAGGLTLTEDKLYTREAWHDFLLRLRPNGMLVVSRWDMPGTYPKEFYRVLSLAHDALAGVGVPEGEIRRHILAERAGPIVAVVISRSPFTTAEIARARGLASDPGFEIVLDPQTARDTVTATIADGRADAAFYASLPFDVTAPSDDRPFFFQTERLSALLSGSGGQATNQKEGLPVVLFILGMTIIMTIMFVVSPLIRRSGVIPKRAAAPALLYFGGIGLGFMLIEIAQLQRLMIFLGDPIFGLTVVLASLLLFGGFGSATVRPSRPGGPPLWLRPIVVVLTLSVIGLMTVPLTHALRGFGVQVRVLVSVAALAPAGFVMGMMFPTGMLLWASQRALQPWFWGINGATSVIASVLGILISMLFGISVAFWSGVACYVLCALIAVRMAQRGA